MPLPAAAATASTLESAVDLGGAMAMGMGLQSTGYPHGHASTMALNPAVGGGLVGVGGGVLPAGGGPTLQLARRRRGGPKDSASRQAQAHRRWTSIAAGSEEWKAWEKTTKQVIEEGRGDAIKFVVPPRAEANDQTYVLFALDGPFQLTSFSLAGRRFAIFERMPVDHMIEGSDGDAGHGPREYEPDPQKAAAQDLADAARDLVKIQTEIAMGLRDKDGRVLPARAPPAGQTHSPEAAGAQTSGPDDQATPGALPGSQHEAKASGENHPQAEHDRPGASPATDATHGSRATSSHAEKTSEVAGSHTTIVGAGGGLLLAANMTLLLTERPGASLVVGPCYANVQEGSQAMQNGSYAIGLSEIFAIDFEASRRLEAQKAEAAAIEAAFLRELEKEEGKKTGRKSKSKKKKKKPAAGISVQAAAAEPGEEEEPIPEDLEELTLSESATAHPGTSDSDREDEARPAAESPVSVSAGGVSRSAGLGGSSPASPGGWSVVGEKKKPAQLTKGVGSGSPVEPLDLQQEAAVPQEYSSSPPPPQQQQQQHAPSSATSEPGSAGKKSRGRRGGRRRKRGGKSGTPDSATTKAEQHPRSPAFNQQSGRVQPQQQNGWVQNGNSPGAWQAPDAGQCINQPVRGSTIRAQSVVTGPRYCESGARPSIDVSASAHASPDPWCSRGAPEQPEHKLGNAAAAAVRPNWGSLRLGNGLFDPSAGFLGPADSTPAHEPALMQSIVGALGLDDL